MQKIKQIWVITQGPVGFGHRHYAHRVQRGRLRVVPLGIENSRVAHRDMGPAVVGGSVRKVDFPMRSNLVAMETDSMRHMSRQYVCKV